MAKLLQTCLIGSIMAVSMHANAAGSRHDIYTELGVATIDNGNTNSTGYHYKIGYNYYITPFIALDLGYHEANTLKDADKSVPSNEFNYNYAGWSVGVKGEQPIAQHISLYIKGGANSLTITETSYDNNQAKFVETEESGVYPYAGLGVDLLTPNKNVRVHASYTYQMLEGDASSSTFNLGATLQY